MSYVWSIGSELTSAKLNNMQPIDKARIYAAMMKRNTVPVVMVALGSSTTAGNGASDAAHSYVNLLAAAIQTTFPLTSGSSPATRTLAAAVATPPSANGVQMINAGVAGTTSANYITGTTIPQIAALHPSIIFHMIGANDYANGVAPAIYQSNLASQVGALNTALAAASSIPFIHVLIHTFARPDIVSPTYPWDQYLTALRAFGGTDVSRIMVIDQSYAYTSIGIPGLDPYAFKADTLHLNDSGHAFMAELIRADLQLTERV